MFAYTLILILQDVIDEEMTEIVIKLIIYMTQWSDFLNSRLISPLTQAFALSSTRASSGVWEKCLCITGGVIEKFILCNIVV